MSAPRLLTPHERHDHGDASAVLHHDPRAQSLTRLWIPRGGTAPEIRSSCLRRRRRRRRQRVARRSSHRSRIRSRRLQPFEAAPPVDDGFGAFGEEDPAPIATSRRRRASTHLRSLLITPHAEEPHTQPSSSARGVVAGDGSRAGASRRRAHREQRDDAPAETGGARVAHLHARPSMPPYRLENPAPLLAKAPLLPGRCKATSSRSTSPADRRERRGPRARYAADVGARGPHPVHAPSREARLTTA